MRRLIVVATLAICAFALAPAARAVPWTFTAHLDGPSENPANASPGTGDVIVLWDGIAHTLSIHTDWTGLTAGTTVAHIHCCVPPDPAGVAVTPGTLPGFPVGVMAGTYDTVIDLTNAASYTTAFRTTHGGTAASAEIGLIDGMVDGAAYFNIHTSNFPSGEIRGFLQVVPEPATLTLFALAVAAVASSRRRRG